MSEKINDFVPETASLLASLTAAGFTIYSGSNGEESTFKRADMPEADFMAELLGCDEAWVYVCRNATKESAKTPGKRVRKLYTLYLVFGNSPGELVCDYSIPADEGDAAAMETATDEHADKWFGKKQPQTTRG